MPIFTMNVFVFLRFAVVIGVFILANGFTPVSVASAQQSQEETATLTNKDELMARAQKSGTIKIIVGVKSSFTPEGHLDREDTEKQRNDIATAQEQLLNALENPSSVRKFETIPYMAITVTPSDLTRIMNAPSVTSIEEDIAVAPAGLY